jgi:hypothetical protein
MWLPLLLLRTQALVEYVALQPRFQGARDLFYGLEQTIRQNPLQTAGIILALVLLYFVVARFNSL